MMTKREKKPQKPKIISLIAIGLLTLVVAVGIFTMWLAVITMSDKIEREAFDLTENNVEDVSADINLMSNRWLDSFAERFLDEDIFQSAHVDDPEQLSDWLQYAYQEQGVEVNVINEKGIIVVSSNPANIGYDMHRGEEASAYLKMLEQADDSDQDSPVITYDQRSQMRYVGKPFADGSGFLEVGLDNKAYDALIRESSMHAVTNRRIGEEGYLLICTTDLIILDSYHRNYNGKTMEDAGITIDPQRTYSYEESMANVFGVRSLICINKVTDVFIVGVYPEKEAEQEMAHIIRNTLLTIVIVFGFLFVVLFVLLKKLVADSIVKVNDSLSKITSGDLEEKVDVRKTYEFDSLSTGINETVDRLKDYIAEAEARIDEDLQNAQTIQRNSLPSIFPPFPEHKEFEIYASMAPATEVGGDFYDFFRVSHGTLGFLIADVSGKGIPGALFMMRAKGTLHALAQRGLSPKEVFDAANATLCDGNDSDMFVTAWMGYLNFHTGEVTFVNAGHNRPLLLHDGHAKYVNTDPDLMLAGMEDTVYTEHTITLKPGDMLYLYTDGVTEAMDSALQQYGEHRLQKLLSFMDQEIVPDPLNGIACSICRLVAEDVDRFVNGAEQSDDRTMLCIRYLREPDQKK